MGTSPIIVRSEPVRRPPPDAPSARDAELAQAIRRGDERALDRLLAQRWAPLVSYVAGRVGDVELAKDITQEAFALVHVQELSYRDAAEVMGIAPQTVANQVAAALAQLRCELKQLIAEPTDVP